MKRLAAVLAAAALLAAVAQPASATTPRLVGVSAPGLRAFPTAEVARVFLPGPPKTFAGSTSLRRVPAGAVIIVSFRTVPTRSAWAAVLADWQHSGRRIWWVFRHEADRPADPITPTAYHAAYAHLLAGPGANTGNVHAMTVLTGASVYGGYADQWYVAGVAAVGFDVYYLDNVARVMAYARAKGKPLAIPEWGDGTETGVGWQGDDRSLAFAKAYIALLDSSVFAVCWWSTGHNDLTRLPKTAAYLRSLT